jgi:glycosyltransferase involved in cell wall biosynthesis
LKILFLSFYYSPDLGPGAFRAEKLAKALIDQLPEEAHIEVITTCPNRYSSYHVHAVEIEELNQLTIRRIKVPMHRSGMLGQMWAFSIYAFQVLRLVRSSDYQLVFATSARLMTAALGARVAQANKAALYLDLRDIFLETIDDFYKERMGPWLNWIFSPIEKRTLKRANKINLVSGGFKEYFQSRYPNQKCSYFTNAISPEFLDIQGKGRQYPDRTIARETVLTVLYAGNIGEGQGLHKIIPALAKRLDGQISFLVIGDGGRRSQLEQKLIDFGCNNVEVMPPVERNQLLAEYGSADILFVHLNDFKALESVLPSKLFECAASGKPIWAGVSGFAAEFIRSKIDNAAIFEPCNVEDALQAFGSFELDSSSRRSFVEEFSEANIFPKMASDIYSLVKSEDDSQEQPE